MMGTQMTMIVHRWIRWEHDNDVYGYRWIRWDGKMIFVNVQYNKVIQVKS